LQQSNYHRLPHRVGKNRSWISWWSIRSLAYADLSATRSGVQVIDKITLTATAAAIDYCHPWSAAKVIYLKGPRSECLGWGNNPDLSAKCPIFEKYSTFFSAELNP
jgi:hypothetical protein